MTARAAPNVLSIPPGVAFLPCLADALLEGRLVPGFRFDRDPLTLADATIYVPTRRAARELRSVFVDRLGGRAAILPVIRPLGEFDEDAAAFEVEGPDALDLAPPVGAIERILSLAPLVRAWKSRVPAEIAARFQEGVVVPASAADAVWLSRDLAALMDEVETEGADWTALKRLVPDDLAGWWQVTLEFLRIVTAHWPAALAAMARSNPAAHRNALIEAEAERLSRNPPSGPVVAAGSTGSIPATARLLAAIARLPDGAVILPGLDMRLDTRAWEAVGAAESPSAFGHPQYGLKKLIGALGIARDDVAEIGTPGRPLAARRVLLSEAMRPAETTDGWADDRETIAAACSAGALADVTLVEAANEREEALAIAVALRHALAEEGAHAALVTPDRDLARRVCTELARFGIKADDSGGTPLAKAVPALMVRHMLEAVFRPGDPAPIVSLLKHPLMQLGFKRETARTASETIELIALRGGTGRPDISTLADLFETRLRLMEADPRKPFWFARLDEDDLSDARAVLQALGEALAPLAAARDEQSVNVSTMARLSGAALEALARGAAGDVAALYRDEAGDALATFLRSLNATEGPLAFAAQEWPDVFAALIATETVKPRPGADPRVSIWGTLEARLQSVDTLVLGGLNEGAWPRAAIADRFMSRLMKGEIDLEPPERRIGQAAHDFMMAMGAPRVVLTRAARAGDAPAVGSRWLQRLLTAAGKSEAEAMRSRGRILVDWARTLDERSSVPFADRPRPTPPVEARPRRFSVTEIETLRRDPYAVYARRILDLRALDPLIRDPGAAERGNLFHDILHRFIASGADPTAPEALQALRHVGRAVFGEVALPADIEATWWPRFERTALGIVGWERSRADGILSRHAEARAKPFDVAETGKTLSGYADRIDLRADGSADILDYKTGSTPSKGQAHTLVSPQLALEAALLARGAFAGPGPATPCRLAYVRLKANGDVEEESILKHSQSERTAVDLAEDAWIRLTALLVHYDDPNAGYLSRALPFREADMEGEYDHLARVLEWSAGGDEAGGESE